MAKFTKTVRVRNAYNEMEDEPNGSANVFSYDEETFGGLGSAIELSASVPGVVPDDTFTVDQAVNSTGFGKFQVKLSFITGICWMADSMEMMILSIISPALHCAWGIPDWKQALLTTCVFIGMMFSAVFWGHMSDKYGRKTALVLSAILLCFYGGLSALSPTYYWMLFLRMLVGFAIGCTPQAVTLYSEFLPSKQRGKCVILLECFWALGACMEVLLALLVMPVLGWRWLLGFSAIPVLLFICVTPWLPESARFLAARGETDRALGVLKSIANDNKRSMLLGRLTVDDISEYTANEAVGSGGRSFRSGFAALLRRELRTTTLLLWFIYTACAFCYYGIVLMSTELLAVADRDKTFCVLGEGKLRPASESDADCIASCRPLDYEDYVDLLWTTIAEFPGILVTVAMVEYLGRKKTMALEFLAFCITIFLLFVCTSKRYVLTILLFMARGIVSGVFQAAYVYTPEVYPTRLRALGVGMCSSMSRLGAMITPFVAQVLVQTSVPMTLGLYGFVGFLACIASLLLPIETRGRAMM